MFPNKEERLKAKENEMLEIFILLEKNTYEASKEASIRYMKLTGIDRMSIALVEAKAKYKIFLET